MIIDLVLVEYKAPDFYALAWFCISRRLRIRKGTVRAH